MNSLVFPMNTTLLQNLIESILDDEALTDGLTDDDAQVIINWCIEEVETLFKTQSTESEIKEQTEKIKQKARLVCQIANDIQDGEGETKIRSCLEQVITNPDAVNGYLDLNKSEELLSEKIEKPLNI